MKDLLSIGSVVLLKEADKRIMITGYYPTIIRDNEITYDYCGCLFPEGVIDSDSNMLFNHDQIDKIFYYGLIDEEQKDFMNRLKEVVEEENKESLELPNLINNEQQIETFNIEE